MNGALTAAARVGAALSHREGDRVPYFLPANMHGSRLLGVSLPAYLGNPSLVVQGQLELLRRLGHDAVSCFLCAAAEAEAFGCEVLVYEDGPPNAGAPPLRSAGDIERLGLPRPDASPWLRRTLEVAASLRREVGEEVPILGLAVSPFSLPAMLLGLGPWFDLLEEAPGLAGRLLQVTEPFCAAWANALLEAGASAIGVAEPLASPGMVPRARYRELGLPALRRAIAATRGPVAVSTASAPCGGVATDLAGAGAVAVGVAVTDDLTEMKRLLRGRAAVMGGLPGLQMRRWQPADVEREVRAAIEAAGPGGGFLLSEHHGEVPLQVPLEVLEAVGGAVRRLGRYPLGGAGDGS